MHRMGAHGTGAWIGHMSNESTCTALHGDTTGYKVLILCMCVHCDGPPQIMHDASSPLRRLYYGPPAAGQTNPSIQTLETNHFANRNPCHGQPLTSLVNGGEPMMHNCHG